MLGRGSDAEATGADTTGCVPSIPHGAEGAATLEWEPDEPSGDLTIVPADSEPCTSDTFYSPGEFTSTNPEPSEEHQPSLTLPRTEPEQPIRYLDQDLTGNPELIAKLQRYHDLVRAEREQRELVYILTGQAAQYGSQLAPPQLQQKLRQQRAALEQLRKELAQLEHKLEQEQRDHASAKSAHTDQAQLLVQEQQIERIKSDIDHKKKLIQIHEANIRRLEYVQAMQAVDTPLHIINTRKRIDAEFNQLNAELNQLNADWNNQELELRLQYELQTIPDSILVRKNRHRTASAAALANPAPDDALIALTARFQEYQSLQRSERELRAQVRLLSRQAAQYGPLLLPAQLQQELDKQRDALEQLRAELAQLEHDLAQARQAHTAAKQRHAEAAELQTHTQQIERLQSDIEDKHEQIQIHEANLRALERRQAIYGLDTPLHVINERAAVLQQIVWLHETMRAAEQILEQEYKLPPEVVSGLRIQHERAFAITAEPATDHPEPATTLNQYRLVQQAERQRRDLVRILERQIAQYGPLRAPLYLQYELHEQRAALLQSRQELAQLENKLTQVHEQQIERIQSDIEEKREQIQVHEANIRTLEHIQASYSTDTPIHIVNALEMIKAELGQLNVYLGSLEGELRIVYGLRDIEKRISEQGEVNSTPESDWPTQNAWLGQPAVVFTAHLQQYQALHQSEREQHELVSLLERQFAQYGPLMAPAQLQQELDKQRVILARLRGELTELEAKLAQEQHKHIVNADKADDTWLLTHTRQIERLQSDIKEKREQIQIHEVNLRALEQRQALYGPDSPLHVDNERKVVLQQLTWLREAIHATEQILHQKYGLPLEIPRELVNAQALGDSENS